MRVTPLDCCHGVGLFPRGWPVSAGGVPYHHAAPCGVGDARKVTGGGWVVVVKVPRGEGGQTGDRHAVGSSTSIWKCISIVLLWFWRSGSTDFSPD